MKLTLKISNNPSENLDVNLPKDEQEGLFLLYESLYP